MQHTATYCNTLQHRDTALHAHTPARPHARTHARVHAYSFSHTSSQSLAVHPAAGGCRSDGGGYALVPSRAHTSQPSAAFTSPLSPGTRISLQECCSLSLSTMPTRFSLRRLPFSQHCLIQPAMCTHARTPCACFPKNTHTASFKAVFYRRDEGGKGRAKAMRFLASGDNGGEGAGGSGQGARKGMGGEGSSEEKLRRWKAEAKVDHLNFFDFFLACLCVCVVCVCKCVCVCMCVRVYVCECYLYCIC